jgi:hypothetical protein
MMLMDAQKGGEPSSLAAAKRGWGIVLQRERRADQWE